MDTYSVPLFESKSTNPNDDSDCIIVSGCCRSVVLPHDGVSAYHAGYRKGAYIFAALGLCVNGALMVFSNGIFFNL